MGIRNHMTKNQPYNFKMTICKKVEFFKGNQIENISQIFILLVPPH